jgi:hypothetical protein
VQLAEVCPTDRTKDQRELRSVDLTVAGKTNLNWESLVAILRQPQARFLSHLPPISQVDGILIVRRTSLYSPYLKCGLQSVCGNLPHQAKGSRYTWPLETIISSKPELAEVSMLKSF